MFETVCLERIQPFDDSIPPDDEELDKWTEKEFTYDVSYTNQTATTITDDTSSDDDEHVMGPRMIRELKTGSSSTTDSDEEDDGSSNSPSNANATFYTGLVDDHAASLLLHSEQRANDSPVDVKPVPHGTIADWTNEPDESQQDVGWANFGSSDQLSNVVTKTTRSIVQEEEVPTSHLAEVAQSPADTEDPANQGYSPLQVEDDRFCEVPVDVPAENLIIQTPSQKDERSVEETVVVFDDNHMRTPELLDEVVDHSISPVDNSAQVQADNGNKVKLDSEMVNHQETMTTDINNTYSTESDNNKQSLGGERSPDNISDKKLTESSNEADESPLGLRFTGINKQSENKMNEKTEDDDDDDDDDLLDELLSTSRGAKYVIDSQEESNDVDKTEESTDEDLQNNFNFLSSGMLGGSRKTGSNIVAINSQKDQDLLDNMRAEAKEAFQQYMHETQEDGDDKPRP